MALGTLPLLLRLLVESILNEDLDTHRFDIRSRKSAVSENTYAERFDYLSSFLEFGTL